jgi:uncharacterized protein (TIGR02594 family)
MTMIDSAPVWLATMRKNAGVKWAPGDGSNPQITQWLKFISSRYPATAAYCATAMYEGYFPWSGLAVGYCMASAGIEPMFGSSDKERFLWAESWLDAGNAAKAPQPGDIVVFDFGAGDQHVTLFEKDLADNSWQCLGGNQSHEVKLANFAKDAMIGIRRPSMGSASFVISPARPSTQHFSDCVALMLASDNGNVDDPRDRAGRTSRGITQDDWDKWRLTRPGLPSDVYQAPHDQILAIYHDQYWNAVKGDQLPPGVDYALFDCAVLNGVGTAARILQARVGVEVDGDIGTKTLAACAVADWASLINQICDDRLRRMQGASTWPVFGVGWTWRVQQVRADALRMAGAGAAAPGAQPVASLVPSPLPAPSIEDVAAQMEELQSKLELIMSYLQP